MGMGLDYVHHFFESNMGMGYTRGGAIPFHGHILQAEVHGIHAQELRQFIQCTLHGEGSLRMTRSAVRCRLWLVADHVIAIYKHVVYLVGTQCRGSSTSHG